MKDVEEHKKRIGLGGRVHNIYNNRGKKQIEGTKREEKKLIAI